MNSSIGQALLEDHVHEPLITATLVPGSSCRWTSARRAMSMRARVDDDELGAPAQRLLDVQRADGVRLAGVGADDEDRVGLFEVLERVGHGAAAQRLAQAGDGARVAEPRAVVDVLRADDGAHELLEEVVVLVGAARRREPDERVGAVRRP